MNTVVVGPATIPVVDCANIGISMSGGADSAVLLYILMSNLAATQQLHIYAFGRRPTHYSTITSSRSVAKLCSELTGFTNYEHHIDYGDEQNRQTLFHNPSKGFKNGTIDFLYTGITANPDLEIAQSFYGYQESFIHEMRDPAVTRDIMLNERVCTPFTNLNKQDIARIYKELNILDTLFPYTRSCESYDPVHLGTHCKQCWWCAEREWGFGNI